jgi:hypothetical protein
VQWHVDNIKDIGDRRWEKIENGTARYVAADDKVNSDDDDSEDDIGSDVEVVFSDSEVEDVGDD